MKSAGKKKRVSIEQVLLGTVGAVGLVGIALVAPNALRALDQLRRFSSTQHRSRYKCYLNKALLRLEKKGLIEKVHRGTGRFYSLTERGAFEFERYRSRQGIISKKKWDGKWRVVIFDVKEVRRRTRDRIRGILQEFGFQKLQNSVWVNPYECEEAIELLKVDCRIGKDVIYMVVDKIEYDTTLRQKFQLG